MLIHINTIHVQTCQVDKSPERFNIFLPSISVFLRCDSYSLPRSNPAGWGRVCSTILYSTLQYCTFHLTILHKTVQYCTLLYGTYCITLYNTVKYCTVLSTTVSNQSLQRVSTMPQSTLDKSSRQYNLFSYHT